MGAERRWIGVLASVVGLTLLWIWVTGPLLRCPGECFVDYAALHGGLLGNLESADARLNAWILGWVHHALGSAPGSLFDANIFHPHRNTLAASEHLLGIALPLLPLRLVGANAVALHQTAVVASFLLTALTTFALVRWLTASSFAAFAAGAMAMLMPWRMSELAHVQLLSAEWFPLVWLLLARVVYRDRPRPAAVWLSIVVTLQVLTSFYLAYFLLLSCAVLVPVLWLQAGVDRTSLLRLGAAAVLPGAVLLAVAQPYLEAQGPGSFDPLAELFESVTPAEAWSMLRPVLDWQTARQLPSSIYYGIPLGVCVLALLALIPERPAGGDERRQRRRGFVFGLLATSAAALVLSLGRQLQVGDASIALPAEWLARLVPGFENLRSPLRWMLLIGCAFPVLAGVGVGRLEKGLERRPGGRVAPWLGRGLVVVALALTLPSGRIPSRAAWIEGEEGERLYRALAALPEGAVVEVPWRPQGPYNVQLSSRYMLGSTLHWKPLANGSSGYYPPGYALLSELGARLPEPRAMRQLQDLLGARWLVLHDHLLSLRDRARWAQFLRKGSLRVAFRSPQHSILELRGWREGARYQEAFLSSARRPETFAGLPRSPLALPPDAGRLAARAPRPLYFRGRTRIPSLIPLEIENASDVAWPGFDVDPEGLVRVRYTFEQDRGDVVLTDTAALIVDVEPQSRVATSVALRPPLVAGRYRLRLELVQTIGAAERPLPVTPAELWVRVEEAAPPPES